ncbi:unnamed protein product, partial [Polarella glacialis]
DSMIESLVSRMPQQSREQYEHFFLQLSFIASTTTRLRNALECGSAETVEEALESAENVGVLPYLMKMAVAQADTEVRGSHESHETWLGSTDECMAPLLQSQAVNMVNQKALARSNDLLGGRQQHNKEMARNVMMGLADANEK